MVLTPRAPRILFVDDDPNLGAAMRRNFATRGIELIVASDSTQGLQEAITTQPDAIITDLQMPNISGENLIEFLAGNPSVCNIPVCVITGRWGARMTSRMRRCGVLGVFEKPVDLDELISALDEFIEAEY